ncbi:MAG: flavin-containing monooxygenase [Nannocystaceae bacterium]|nr:NAD(P)/FAD-dependent oxidoreductase [bacterium]
MEHYDVLIVGAGLSGIGAAYHVQTMCPGKRYAILEGRPRLGGTWDLFRYPGIRSDSDMHTLGYSFRPWTAAKAIADGPAILNYIRETAEENGIDRHIQFNSKVVASRWSSAEKRWTVTVSREDTGSKDEVTCNFLFVCSGYYDYDEGYTPDFEGREDFEGEIVHPQKWTDDVEYAGKNVVVIGSGATAVTLVPSMADKASHVTMLQRTPTYVVTRPAEDKIANALRKRLPSTLAYGITRWKNVAMGQAFFKLCQGVPGVMKKVITHGVKQELGQDYDVDTHFNPPYAPWDQRLCLVPDSDLFDVIRQGKASVVTGHIDRFVPEGIRLRDGQVLPADLIVTATGLRVKALGGMDVTIDDEPLDLSNRMSYKAMMFSDVPNMAMCFGYTNASWTLKADLTSLYVCRLINHMDEHGYDSCTPKKSDDVVEEPFIPLQAGYIDRAASLLPKAGNKVPWKLKQNYFFDLLMLKAGKVDDGVMQFR